MKMKMFPYLHSAITEEIEIVEITIMVAHSSFKRTATSCFQIVTTRIWLLDCLLTPCLIKWMKRRSNDQMINRCIDYLINYFTLVKLFSKVNKRFEMLIFWNQFLLFVIYP